MDVHRAGRRARPVPEFDEPRQAVDLAHLRHLATDAAIIGTFAILAGSVLYLARPVLLPMVAALIVGTTLAPLLKRGRAIGVPAWIMACLLVFALMVIMALALTLLAAPIIAWIDRAPEIAETLKQRLYALEWPLAALRDLQDTLTPPSPDAVTIKSSQFTLLAPVVTAVTPALAQFVIFFATLLFFLVTQLEIRGQIALMFAGRRARLRFIRIANDIEHNLASYVAVVTGINICLGATVALGAWLFGLPNPMIFGAVAALLNFIPYIGPALFTAISFGVGVVTFPSIAFALLPPLAFVVLNVLEGQIITPTVLGRRLTLNPLVVFVAIVFWAWLWGPVGAFLAVPLLIVALVAFHHMALPRDPPLPG